MKTTHLTTLVLSIAALSSPAFGQSSSSGSESVEASDNSAPAVMKKTQDRIEKIDKIKKDAKVASDGVTPATAQKMAIEAASAKAAPQATEEPDVAPPTTPSSRAVEAMNPTLTVDDSPALKAIVEATERNESIEETKKAANRATAAANADAAVEAASSNAKKPVVIETTTTTTAPVPATGALITTE